MFFFFFKQKTAYEMCGRDWSSDVCSSDLTEAVTGVVGRAELLSACFSLLAFTLYVQKVKLAKSIGKSNIHVL